MAELFLSRRLADPRFNNQRVDLSTTAVTPWYAAGAASPAPLQSAITKRHNFAKRKKYYTSDSSGSERETEGHKEGVIHRAPAGSGKDYYVYYKGKKISFGDSSMKNRNNNDGARANFNARHSCSEKKDKTKAGYWACRVWRKGFRGPGSEKKKG